MIREQTGIQIGEDECRPVSTSIQSKLNLKQKDLQDQLDNLKELSDLLEKNPDIGKFVNLLGKINGLRLM